MERHGQAAPAAKRFDIEFRRDYQQHVSIGPSCGIAMFDAGRLTVWSHAQGMFPLRMAIAEMCRMPTEAVDCIHVEGSGCYGHNGADDAGADAALLARALPGRPVRVQYMREDENVWEPKGPAMVTRIGAALDDQGMIVDWNFEVWSNTHSSRPPGAGQLAPAWALAQPFQPETPKPIPLPEGDGDRNSQPLYAFPNVRAVYHFIEDAPIRVSAMRGLGAYMNVFSLESFMDDLARAANADPVAFRLKHLQDDRAKEVIQRAAQEFGWDKWSARPHVGRGFAFARYKNLGAYAALALELSVDSETGRVKLQRAEIAVDSGEAVNPDGIRNQIEGGFIQSASWTLYERVAFDRTRILSRDWSTYPILRFRNLPETVRVHVIDRPDQPFLGTGEATQGPTAAAIGNALRDATGRRFTHLPLTTERVRAELTGA
jgi:CO/xanthine dehydrogenase Mo-binding subunit